MAGSELGMSGVAVEIWVASTLLRCWGFPSTADSRNISGDVSVTSSSKTLSPSACKATLEGASDKVKPR